MEANVVAVAEVLVNTPSGLFRGVRVAGVSVFLGIPYGRIAETGGRFRPASPVQPHVGVRDALHYGPAAIQRDSQLDADPEWPSATRLYFPRGGSTEGVPTSEDCLTVDIWTPSTAADVCLPVLVWFHGGAFRSGSSGATITAGDAIARTGRAVVVGVNHRLGILGFTELGEFLGPEYIGSGALGLRDMVLGLEWVRDSVGSFGGDPRSVTVMGQSGGGAKAAALMRMPRAKGLFRRCIVQSPSAGPIRSEAAVAQTVEVLRALQLDITDADQILELPAHAFEEAQKSIAGLGPFPVADDGVHVLAETDARIPELASGVDLLTGSTVHEWSLVFAGAPWYTSLVEADIADSLRKVVPQLEDPEWAVADSLERVPTEAAPLRISRILAERSFGIIAEQLARRHYSHGRVFRYQFRYESEAEPGPLGATHCIEVPCVFGTVRWTPLLGDRPERWLLERDVMSAWLAFAECGVPVFPDGTDWPEAGVDGSNGILIDAPEWEATSLYSPTDIDGIALF